MDGQWEIAQGQSIRPSWDLESPSGAFSQRWSLGLFTNPRVGFFPPFPSALFYETDAVSSKASLP